MKPLMASDLIDKLNEHIDECGDFVIMVRDSYGDYNTAVSAFMIAARKVTVAGQEKENQFFIDSGQ